MTAVHQQGPFLVYGYSPPTGTGTSGDTNPDAGPGTSYQGDGVFDPRYPYGGANQSYTTPVSGVQWSSFFNNPYIALVDAVPSTIATANIAALQAPTINTPLTLVNATGSGITVTTAGAVAAGYLMAGSGPGVKAVAPATAVLAIDGIYKPLFVTPQVIHDPTVALARCVSLTSAANLSGLTFTVRGFDVYGYKMTETITGPNANTVNGQKAWKYIISVTPSATNAGTVSVGTSDIYGINMRSDKWEYNNFYWNGAFVTVSTGWVAAVTTTATATTGDVRGTYTVQGVASNGVRRLALFLSIPVASMLAAVPNNTSALFGVAQFSDF